MRQTLEQKRAKYALTCIDEIVNKSQLKEKYSTFVSRTPTMILNNGLGQTLAFVLSKSENREDAAKTFYNQLQAWLCGANVKIYPEGDLIRQLMDNGRKDYIHAQSETLTLLNWMKKFSDAYLVEHKEVKVDAPSV